MSVRCDGHVDSVGVVLFQLGGPDSLESVEPFLENLFSDPDIIDFPFARLARPALARLIASRRAKHARQHYASIGGRSPLRELTELQATALERELRKSIEARVFVAMRYWHPSTEEAVREIHAQPLRRLVLLPLYPQYSRTTAGSSLNEWNRRYQPNKAAREGGDCPAVRVVRQFYDRPAYVNAVVERINQGLERFGSVNRRSAAATAHGPALEPFACHSDSERSQEEESLYSAQGKLREGASPAIRGGAGAVAAIDGCPAGDRPDRRPATPRLPNDVDSPAAAALDGAESPAKPPQDTASSRLQPSTDVRLVFSAHGVPQSVIEAGDPYQEQVEATVRLVMGRGGWRNPYALCYQSRVGPGRWLEPSLRQTLVRLAREGAENVLVIPIAFVSDHVETLSEIGIEARELAYRLGIRQFEVMPALNDSPKFIQALADLVLGTLHHSM